MEDDNVCPEYGEVHGDDQDDYDFLCDFAHKVYFDDLADFETVNQVEIIGIMAGNMILEVPPEFRQVVIDHLKECIADNIKNAIMSTCDA